MSDAAAIAALLKPLEIAKELSDQELEILAGVASHKMYEAGERVVDFGEPDYDLIVVVKGGVEIRTAMNDLLDRLSVGCLIGEVSFIDGRPRSARVVADGECETVSFPPSLLRDLRESHPQIVSKVLHYIATVLSQKLRSTTRLMEASFV